MLRSSTSSHTKFQLEHHKSSQPNAKKIPIHASATCHLDMSKNWRHACWFNILYLHIRRPSLWFLVHTRPFYWDNHKILWWLCHALWPGLAWHQPVLGREVSAQGRFCFSAYCVVGHLNTFSLKFATEFLLPACELGGLSWVHLPRHCS